MSLPFSLCARRLAGSLACRHLIQPTLLPKCARASPMMVMARCLQTHSSQWNMKGKEEESSPIDILLPDGNPTPTPSRGNENNNHDKKRNNTHPDNRSRYPRPSNSVHTFKWDNFGPGKEDPVRCFRIQNVPPLATPDDIEDLLAPCHIVEAHRQRIRPSRVWYVCVDKCTEEFTEKTLRARDGNFVGGYMVSIHSADRSDMVQNCKLAQKENEVGWRVEIKNVPVDATGGEDEVRNLFTGMGLDVKDVRVFAGERGYDARFQERLQTSKHVKNIAHVTFGKATHAYRAILEHNHTMVADLFKNAQTSKDCLYMKILY